MPASEQISIWKELLTLLLSLPDRSAVTLPLYLRHAVEVFESHILTQSLDDLPAPVAGKMGSYITESHRLLRLISMDAMFIATARTPTTLQQRSQTYQDKLTLLIQYCQAVVELLGNCSIIDN